MSSAKMVYLCFGLFGVASGLLLPGETSATPASVVGSDMEEPIIPSSLRVAGLADFFENLNDTSKPAARGGSKQGGSSGKRKPARSNNLSRHGLSREDNRRIQQALEELGYAPGPIDGLPGDKTKTAIRQYQQDGSLLVTGIPSLELLAHMESRIDARSRQSTAVAVGNANASTSISADGKEHSEDSEKTMGANSPPGAVGPAVVESAGASPETELPETTQASIAAVVQKACVSVGEECKEQLATALTGFLLENVFSVAEESAVDVERLKWVFSNPGKLGDSIDRVRLYEEIAENEEFMADFTTRLEADVLADMRKQVAKEAVSELGMSIVAGVVSETLAKYYESQGQTEAAAFARTWVEPMVDISLALEGASTATMASAGAGAAVIWIKNYLAFLELGAKALEAEQTGTTAEAQLAALAADIDSIHQTLRGERLTGSLFEGYEGEPLTEQHAEVLRKLLKEKYELQRWWLTSDEAIRLEAFAPIIRMARNFVDPGVPSGLEHANSTNALPSGLPGLGGERDEAGPDVVFGIPEAAEGTFGTASIAKQDLERFATAYKASFSAICADPFTQESGLPCPFVVKGSCEGEGCVTRGPMRATEDVVLVAFPGSDVIITRVHAGDKVFTEYGEVWLAPCKTRVTTKTEQPLPHAGSFFWRLRYVGEGFSEYWSRARTLQFEDSSMDTISTGANGWEKDACNGKTHREWLLMVDANGRRGWTDAPNVFAGSDRYSGDDPSGAPDWIRAREKMPPLPVEAIYATVLDTDDRSRDAAVGLVSRARPDGVSDTPTRLEQIEQALPYAELSARIYDCGSRCLEFTGSAGRWVPILDSRDLLEKSSGDTENRQWDTANLKASVRREDPSKGFHAAAFRNAQTKAIAIVYEGTKTREDWEANFKQPFIEPLQYELAIEFAEEVERRFCNDTGRCRSGITLTGHSLGGGLAQYAAITLGRKAYTFNAAGLWDSTAGDIDTGIAAQAEIIHFNSKGYKFGFRLGVDFVPYTGVQFAERTIDVPIDLPVWAWDTVTVALVTHNMERLRDAMSAMVMADAGDREDTATPPLVASGAWIHKGEPDSILEPRNERDGFSLTDRAVQAPPMASSETDVPQTGEWGPGIVPDSSIELRGSPCADKEVRSCLAELGLSNQAISFSIAAGGDLAGGSLATDFVELGKVDLARISYPFSPWEGPVLVNGTPSTITPGGDSGNLTGGFKDGASRKFLARFSKATGWSYGVSGHRSMPPGGQRFVVSTTLQDSCRACPVVGTAIAFLDFDPIGRQLSRRNIGLMDTSRDLLGDQGKWTPGLLADHPAYLQYRLNLLGYDAGPMDGVPGKRTREALVAFQREQCIPSTGALDGATLERLSSADPFKAPCAGRQPGLASTEFCDGADCPPSEQSRGPAVYTPPKGSAERKGIMDAIREKYSRNGVLFRVHYLKVSGDWAWARVTGTINGEPAYESESALIRKLNGNWTEVASQNHSGECDNDPVCHEDERTGPCVFDPVCSEQGFARLIAKLKGKYPDVPLAIVEGHQGESPTARQFPRTADGGKPAGSDHATSGHGDAGSHVGTAHGAQCLPAMTSNRETECSLCEPVSVGLYRPKEVHQANFDGEGGQKYRYEWKGGCANGSIDGFGTLTVYADEVDFFEVLANERSGVLFRSGAPIVAVPAGAVDVRLSSGAALAAPGACPSSRDLMIWAIVDGPLQLHSSSLSDQVLRFSRQRALERCPSLEGVRYELQVVERQAVDDPGSSKESKVFTNPLERLRRKRNTPSRGNEATSGVERFITEWLGGTRYGDYVSCKGSKLSVDSDCDRQNYNSFVRAHGREMTQRHSVRVRAEQERLQRAAAEAQRRAQEAKVAEAQRWLDAEVSLLTQRAERFLNDGVGTPAELATALQIDERRTLERLEGGLQLDIEPVEGLRTIRHGGKNYYGVTHRATSLIADAERRHRNLRMKENFSWGGWFDQTSSAGSERRLELTCLFRRASDIPKERRRVGAKLVSLNSVGKNISIALECATGASVEDTRTREKPRDTEQAQAMRSRPEGQIASQTQTASRAGSLQVETGSSPSQADAVGLQDGSTLTGEITDAKVPFKSSFGRIEISWAEVLAFSDGKLRLIDGTLLNGGFADGEITVATSIGKLTTDLSDIVSIERGKSEQGDELSREEAAGLIQRKRGLPRQETMTIIKTYVKKAELVHRYTPGICKRYTRQYQWTNEVGMLTELVKRKLITFSKERKTTQNNCHHWWVDVGLTPKGREYLVGETEDEYTFRTADITIDEVTGLRFDEGKTMGVAEYEFKAVNVTPFAVKEIVVPEGRKSTFVLFDDGWRIDK